MRPDSSIKVESEGHAADEEVKPEAMDEDAEPRFNEDRDARSRDTKPKFPQKTGDEKWENNLDTKLKPLLGEVDIVEFGGRDMQEWVWPLCRSNRGADEARESKKAAAPHIRQEEPTKYRCKECNKLFKAPEFVVKHVSSKHPELIGDKLDNVSTITTSNTTSC